MGRTEYADIVRKIVHHYAAFKPSYGAIDVEVIENDAAGHYELRYIGWNGDRRIHDCILHVDIKDDKIWLQHDGIYEGITDELLEAGVPADHIVLAWHTEKERRLMGTFAVS